MQRDQYSTFYCAVLFVPAESSVCCAKDVRTLSRYAEYRTHYSVRGTCRRKRWKSYAHLCMQERVFSRSERSDIGVVGSDTFMNLEVEYQRYQRKFQQLFWNSHLYLCINEGLLYNCFNIFTQNFLVGFGANHSSRKQLACDALLFISVNFTGPQIYRNVMMNVAQSMRIPFVQIRSPDGRNGWTGCYFKAH